MAGAAAASQTRLDRLVTLLDSGSTPSIRATAARQLGQIAALRVRGGHHGHGIRATSSNTTDKSSIFVKKEEEEEEEEDASFDEEESFADDTDKTSTSKITTSDTNFVNGNFASTYRGIDGDWEQAIFLISRVLPHLRSKTWDTRIAASQAIESISSACGIWDPDIFNKVTKVKDSHEQTKKAIDTNYLTFSTFSLPQVLQTGKKLLSSAGNEYDQPTFASVEERLAHAKRDMQRLGLGSMAGEEIDLGVDVERELMEDTNPSSTPQGSSNNSSNTSSRPGSSLPPARFATKTNTSVLPPPKFAASSPPSLMNCSTTKLASPSTSMERKKSPTSVPTVSARPTPIEEIDISKLSARERNQLKRKRKLEEKSFVNGTPNEGNSASKVILVENSQLASPMEEKTVKSVNAGKTPGQRHRKDIVMTPILSAPHTPAGIAPANDYMSAREIQDATELVTPSTSKPGLEMGAGVTIANATSLLTPTSVWPFQFISALLLSDLFSPKWEVRHGAALGLRDLFKTQGYGGGRVTGAKRTVPNDEVKREQDEGDIDMAENQMSNEELHSRWCEDVAIRLICVLSLDRLGDFVFDQVIAPVRETTGQTMASLLKWMPASSVSLVHNVLLDMVKQDYLVNAFKGNKNEAYQLQVTKSVAGYAWEVRHAGLLGLKYEVTIRKDLLFQNDHASVTLDSVVKLAILCLRDDDDDVRGVAASTLLPVVDEIVEYLPSGIASLMNQLWDCLVDLKDDLSSSTSRVMDLLSRMVEFPKVITHLLDNSKSSINLLIPRLFPFFRHTISSVRLAVLKALQAFLKVPNLDQDWIDDRLVRLLYQNLIVEERESIREASKETWQTTMTCLWQEDEITKVPIKLIVNTRSHLENFFTILMTPLGSPINYKLFYVAPSAITSRDSHNIDRGIMAQDLSLIGVDAVIRGRLGAAQALGSIMAHWPHDDDAHTFFQKVLLYYLSSSSALQKCLAAVIIQDWAESCLKLKKVPLANQVVSTRLISILDSPAPSTYSEMGMMLQRIQSQCVGLHNCFVKEAKVPKAKVPILPSTVDTLSTDSHAFTIETAKMVMSDGYDELYEQVSAKMAKQIAPILEDRRRKMIADIGFYQSIKIKQDTQVGATVAGAAIAMQHLPGKLNPVIRSIMNSVKFEENIDLQHRSARAVADFIALCSLPTSKANPSEKIIKNLCAFVCQDTTQTPLFDPKQEGIVSIIEAPMSASNGRSGRSATDKAEVIMTEEVRVGKLIRRGAEFALQAICHKFKKDLFEIVPSLWSCMTDVILQLWGNLEDDKDGNQIKSLQSSQGQSIVDCCTLLQVVVQYLDLSLQSKVLSLIQPLIRAIASPFAIIRSASAKSLAAMANRHTERVMLAIVENVLPLLGSFTSTAKRQGSIETLFRIIEVLDIRILPYVIILIVPILGRMSDADDSIRLVATNAFASLVKLVPLEAGLPDPPGFSQELLNRRQDERKFLSQLLDGNKVDMYEIPVKINAQLRRYQQDGVNWMAFLAKFQLHGILCDDMGLGKTLQSICILASKHYERSQSGSISEEDKKIPSLIVCPPTLTGHWCHEIKQYSNNLEPLLYAGQPQERLRLQSLISSHDCIVMSYDTLRNDAANLCHLNWFYCILDEGHIIKNGKTKTTKVVKMVKATHRLILSGTPIQNNVLELWSLFDFLMPGFLGDEKSFMERYGRPILASRDAKVTAREHERASLALEALHKQVLPFLLRRMKDDVLDDLPPKIIQDIICDLGEVQRQLYDDYVRQNDPDLLEEALKEEDGEGGEDEEEKKKQHVFQTLQYLRKLVCHPLLVFDSTNSRHREIESTLQKKGGQLSDIDNAPKLLALKQLLNDCGIGLTSTNGLESSLLDYVDRDSAVSQHRVLVFCQQRQMLDLVEKDLFQKVMPTVSYMRLDGSVTHDKRFAMVQKFNSDPSLDVLLLTTSVGGLGLTLTGADTVIFLEHDWNPMKDLQAMDRAHRLGQKKVVNVYRLITKNTLEEKIMGLQRFKINVAGSIVNQENKEMESMETDQLLDLFDIDGQELNSERNSNGETRGGVGEGKKTKGISQKALLASIESMHDTGDDYTNLTEWKG